MNKVALHAFQETFASELAALEGDGQIPVAVEKVASAFDIDLGGQDSQGGSVTFDGLQAKLAASLVDSSGEPMKGPSRFSQMAAKGKRMGVAAGSAIKNTVSKAYGKAKAGVGSAAKATGAHIMRHKWPYGIGAGLVTAGGLAYGAHRLMKKDDDKD